jgi:hypothetical protein
MSSSATTPRLLSVTVAAGVVLAVATATMRADVWHDLGLNQTTVLGASAPAFADVGLTETRTPPAGAARASRDQERTAVGSAASATGASAPTKATTAAGTGQDTGRDADRAWWQIWKLIP